MSSRRTDYFGDPAAPAPNSLVPGSAVLVANDAGHILMQRRTDSGNWSLPGGAMELGETLGATAVRETREETGLDVELTGVLGIYTDPRHVIAYSDGEVRQEFVVVFLARVVGGELCGSDESTEAAFIDPAQLGTMPIHQSVHLRITHWLQHRNRPYIG